jgi:chromosome segregation ATPase
VTRVEKSVIEVQKQKDVLRQEIASINDDYKSQYSKKQAIDDEMKFLEDTMDDINADMEVRDEEILKVRIRIRQMDIEKDKLEAQMQHLRR